MGHFTGSSTTTLCSSKWGSISPGSSVDLFKINGSDRSDDKNIVYICFLHTLLGVGPSSEVFTHLEQTWLTYESPPSKYKMYQQTKLFL